MTSPLSTGIVDYVADLYERIEDAVSRNDTRAVVRLQAEGRRNLGEIWLETERRYHEFWLKD